MFSCQTFGPWSLVFTILRDKCRKFYVEYFVLIPWRRQKRHQPIVFEYKENPVHFDKFD